MWNVWVNVFVMFWITDSNYRGSKIPPENNCNDKHRRKRFAYESLGLFLFIFSSWGFRGDDNLQSMLVGAVLRKIKSRTWKKQRYFKLQDDGMTIWYKSKKAGNTHCTCKNKFTLSIHYPPRDAPIDAQIFFFFHLKFRWAMSRQYERATSRRFCSALPTNSRLNGASRWSSVAAEATWT